MEERGRVGRHLSGILDLSLKRDTRLCRRSRRRTRPESREQGRKHHAYVTMEISGSLGYSRDNDIGGGGIECCARSTEWLYR